MSGERLFISLVCPDCGGELKGGAPARVFTCFRCGKAFAMERFPESMRLFVLRPKIVPEGKTFYVPFYRIDGKFNCSSPDERKVRAWSNMTPLRVIYYPAFPNLRTLYSEDLTFRYALGLDDVEADDPKEDIPFVDGTRSPSNFETIAKLVWLGYFDRVADVTGAEAEFIVYGVDYCLVPFQRAEDGLRELMLGLTLKGFTELAPNE